MASRLHSLHALLAAAETHLSEGMASLVYGAAGVATSQAICTPRSLGALASGCGAVQPQERPARTRGHRVA